jgi:hypothetical protein
MDCPECEFLSKAHKEARLEYESAELLSTRHHSNFPPTPVETMERRRDSDLLLQARLNLIHIEEELSVHKAGHRKSN